MFRSIDLGPDYMRPVRTQTGTTSDRSPHKCLFLFTLGRSEKPSHAGFTHSGCWTDTNDSDRSEVGPRNHVNTNWFETSQKSLFWACASVLLDHSKMAENRKESKENETRWIFRDSMVRIWLKHWKHQRPNMKVEVLTSKEILWSCIHNCVRQR